MTQVSARYASGARRARYEEAIAVYGRYRVPIPKIKIPAARFALAPGLACRGANSNYRRGLADSLANLALVLANTGRTSDAEKAYRQALPIREKLAADFRDNPTYRHDDWFMLAMAHWRGGEKEQARKWYDQAVGRMDKNKPTDEELRGFRAEAAALLGLQDSPGPPRKEELPEKK